MQATENSRLQLCNPALLSHYKSDAEHKGAIVNNRCLNNDSGSKRGPIDCTATIGCTWDSDKERCNVKS